MIKILASSSHLMGNILDFKLQSFMCVPSDSVIKIADNIAIHTDLNETHET